MKFNGYYYCLQLEENISHSYNYILIFYDKNNKVIKVSCCPSNEDKYFFINFFPTNNWFNENYENNGNYNISGDQISFECGKILYKGTILNDDKLKLFSHSNINGHEDTKEFKFISFEILKDIQVLDAI